MDYNTVLSAIDFISGYDNEMISIGGGEPTLHPRFFDILKQCLWNFSYVWFATNGSKTKTMFRLASIIDNEDWQDNEEETIVLEREGHLVVALSQDYFHDPINQRVVDLWKRQATNRGSGFEIRDVTKSYHGVLNAGRATRTQSYQCENGCVCSDLLIQPDGNIKLCGCRKAPIIGNVWGGIEEKWGKVIQDDEGYLNCRCYQGVGRKV